MRLEGREKEVRDAEAAERKAKTLARQEAMMKDPAKVEQRKHAEKVKKAKEDEKRRRENILKTMADDRKRMAERKEQERLARKDVEEQERLAREAGPKEFAAIGVGATGLQDRDDGDVKDEIVLLLRPTNDINAKPFLYNDWGAKLPAKFMMTAVRKNETPAAPDYVQPLSFPPSHYAKLAPRSYLHTHFSSPNGRRPSGRLPSESRKPSVNTGSLTHCHGSAVVRSGDTAVVCGIRGEILNATDIIDHKPATTPDQLRGRYGGTTVLPDIPAPNRRERARIEDAEEMAYLNLLVPNVELSTGCSPSYLPGAPPSEEAQSLSHRVLTLLHTSRLLSVDNLRIWYHPQAANPPPNVLSPEAQPSDSTSMSLDAPNELPSEDTEESPHKPEVKAYWTLHITLLVLSLSGPPFPTLWGALLAALNNTSLPKAWWDADTQSVLCSPLISDAQTLRINGLPIAATFGVFNSEKDGAGLVSSIQDSGLGKQQRKWILADPDGFEESCCEEMATVVVREAEKGEMEVVRIEKEGGGVVGKEEMKEMIATAKERWREWRGLIRGHG
ncbi:MAG: hypothetical protein Q9218_004589 [Villophora microphyllina]